MRALTGDGHTNVPFFFSEIWRERRPPWARTPPEGGGNTSCTCSPGWAGCGPGPPPPGTCSCWRRGRGQTLSQIIKINCSLSEKIRKNKHQTKTLDEFLLMKRLKLYFSSCHKMNLHFHNATPFPGDNEELYLMLANFLVWSQKQVKPKQSFLAFLHELKPSKKTLLSESQWRLKFSWVRQISLSMMTRSICLYAGIRKGWNENNF